MKPKTGAGSVYLRGQTWWLKYYQDGKAIRESSGSPLAAVALAKLKERVGQVATGEQVNVKADKATVGELLDDLLADYRANSRTSLPRLEGMVAHLRPVFGHRRSALVRGSDVTAYKLVRHEAGLSNATINREVEALQRAYRLGKANERIRYVPTFQFLQENNVRTGFFEREQFEAVRRCLPEYLRPVVTFMYITGWRSRSEVFPLQWHQVDFKAGTVRLEPGTTKNREGRVLFMTPELREMLEARRAATDKLQRESGRIIPHVFHRRSGKPIRNIYVAWEAACRGAGVPGRIPHDFRRTAVRNLERAGVPRSVAMKMTGHKTEAVYRRYAIVSEGDLREAADKLARLAATDAGTKAAAMGTVAILPAR